MLKDRYGNELSTSSTAARDAYGRGVDSLMAATAGTDTAFAEAVAADEGFALGHISLARAKQLMGRGHEAKAPRARALELAAGTTPREQSHIAIFDKILGGQGDAALAAIKEHLKSWPRDAMAFAPATSVFGLIGFCGRVGREKEQLAMIEPFEKDYGDDWWYRTQLAFAQIELGQFGVGEHNIERALAAYPRSAHAAHIRGHLFYEIGEREAGLRFLNDWMKDYPRDGLMHCHNSWHRAVWSLETGRSADAWRIYNDSLRPGASWGPQVNVATDCPAFLLRAEMAGHEREPELWRELAEYSTQWFGRPGLSFVDMHTVLAYAMAGDDEKLAPFTDNPRGSAGDMVPPMARGFKAYAAGDYRTAATEIEPLVDSHERLGGSRAQRDLLEYVVASAKLRGGQRDAAQSFLSRRRPHNAKVGGFPLAGL
jgi:tetratricopeptide (TPR) repeat protein